MTNIDEWDGSIATAPGCNCLCTVIHPDRELCDPDAPRAFISMDTSGFPHVVGLNVLREIVVCAPCGEATMASHPRARGIVVLESREKAAS